MAPERTVLAELRGAGRPCGKTVALDGVGPDEVA